MVAGESSCTCAKCGKECGGSMLTPFGLYLINRYRSIERSVAQAAREELIGLRADIG